MEANNAEDTNIAAVSRIYKALSGCNAAGKLPHGLIADDLEWWFHGPQNCHHMMKMLTRTAGSSSPASGFKFEPRSMDSLEDRVIVEGWEGAQVYWVHVWTLQDGVIVQFREYFNTWLTVRDLRRRLGCSRATTLWQSHPRDLTKRSLPGLMLAI